MRILLPLALSVLPLVCAAAPKEQKCVDHVSVEYKGIQRLNAWGKESPFAAFALTNKAPKEIKFPLDGTYYPLIPHGQYVEMQSRVAAGSWELDAVVLEEFLPPRKWLVIGSGDGVMFFVDMVGPVSDSERSKSREYRVLLKDASGCQHFSQSFRLESR